MAQLMPLPLTVCCFSKIQIGFTFLVLAHPGSPGKRVVKRVFVHGCCLLISAVICQMEILLSKKEAGIPLYLNLACEELRMFGVYEKVSLCLQLDQFRLHMVPLL